MAPVPINDWYDFDDIRNDDTADYILMVDLDENTDGYGPVVMDNGTPSWNTIPNYYGEFNGNGHKIQGITGAAPFDDLEVGGIIKYLHTNNTISSGQRRFGAIANWNRGLIEKCQNTGNVTISADQCVGGIAGRNSGIVRDCVNRGDITNTDTASVAGIIGLNLSGGIYERCLNVGTVSGGSIQGNVVAEDETLYSATDGNFAINATAGGDANFGGHCYDTEQSYVPLNDGHKTPISAYQGCQEDVTVEYDFGENKTLNSMLIHIAYSDENPTMGNFQFEWWDGTEWQTIDVWDSPLTAPTDMDAVYTLNIDPVTTSKVAVRFTEDTCPYDGIGEWQVMLNSSLGLAGAAGVLGADDRVFGGERSEADLKKQSTYEALGWDFEETWTIDEDQDYPELQEPIANSPALGWHSRTSRGFDRRGRFN